VAFVDKPRLQLNRQTVLCGTLRNRGDLRINRSRLRLLFGGDAGVKSRTSTRVVVNGITLQHDYAPAATRADVELSLNELAAGGLIRESTSGLRTSGKTR
jgi:hypothetical protein